MTMTHPPPVVRRDLVPMLIAAPAIIVAALMIVLEANRIAEQWFRSVADTGTFAEAIRTGDYERAFEFIRAGQDPNTPILFRDADFTANREIMIAPLLIAVATRVDNTVRMLMSAGVKVDAPANRYALCLADRLGDKTIAEVIAHDGGPAAKTMTCPDAPLSKEAPLLAFAQ
jgi:hypothetical protein